MYERIGHYRIVRKLGQGGMGEVFEGLHEYIGRRVAIKVLNPELAKLPEVAARFLNEARAANLVKHAGIVDIFEFDRLPDGQPYIVMDYLDGRPLDDLMQESAGPLSIPLIVDIGLQLAQALDAAHEKGIIHRDLKPANVMLLRPGKDGERLVVKVLDFGIAHVAAEHSLLGITQVQTQLGRALGTPPYMAPEQCRGLLDLTGAVDVYALGVLLYEMLAGRPPFVGETAGDTMAMHILSPVLPLAELCPDAPEHLSLLVLDMLAKQPGSRPSMAEVAEDLATIATTVGPAGAGLSRPRSAPPWPPLAVPKPAAPFPPKPRGAGNPAVAAGGQRARPRTRMTGESPGGFWGHVNSALSAAPDAQGSESGRRAYWVAGVALGAAALGLGVFLREARVPPAPAANSARQSSGWVEMYSGTPQNLMSVWGTGETDIWTVGRGGTILHHDGVHWSAAESGTREYLFGIWGSGRSDVWAVGRKGTLLHFDGTAWHAAPSPITDELHAVWGTDSRHVWAVGSLGRILFFDGERWEVVQSGTEYQLRGLWGVSGADLWIVGGNDANEGVIVHYDGRSFSETEIDNRLEAVWGSRADDVWAVGGSLGNEGAILRWDGRRWNPVKTARVEWLHGVWGSSATDVWMMGESGSIRHFDGNQFATIPEQTRATFRGLWGSGKGEVWAVASGGVIYRWRGIP